VPQLPGQTGQKITVVDLDNRVQSIVRGIGVQRFSSIWPAVAQMAVSDVKKNFNESHSPDGTPWIPLAHGRPGGKGRDKPLQDKGLLYASIQGRANDAGVTIGTNVNYAPIHQFGGVIRPKRAKFLAIPLTVEAKRAGSPRNFPGGFRFAPTKNGGWVMLSARPLSAGQQAKITARRASGKALTAGQQRQIAAVPQYLLVREVRVPARPFLGFSPVLLGRVEQLILDRALAIVQEDVRAGGQSWPEFASKW
jgi:phage gpG-like protein